MYIGCGGGNTRAVFLLKDYAAFIILAIIFVFPIRAKLEELTAKGKYYGGVCQVFYFLAVTGGFIVALSLVVSGQNNPFLYIGF